ncbi:MAG: hypothetical protein QOF57_1452 [Frankiaceae bacterium]|nr:hypothetical protein [Frankiaceae bacterium]
MTAAVLVLLTARPAAADVTGPIATLTAGPYLVQPFDAARGETGDTQRFPLTVFDAPNHKVGADVTVSISALDMSGTRKVGPIVATPSLNGFQVDLPPAPPGGWAITATVTGPRGTGKASYVVLGVQQASATSGSSLLLKGIVGTFGLAILTTLIVMSIRGRRRFEEDEQLEGPHSVPRQAEGTDSPA